MRFWSAWNSLKKLNFVRIGQIVLFDKAISESGRSVIFGNNDYIDGIVEKKIDEENYLVKAYGTTYTVNKKHMRICKSITEENRSITIKQLLQE